MTGSRVGHADRAGSRQGDRRLASPPNGMGLRIKTARTAAGLSVVALAEQVGITDTTIRKLESGVICRTNVLEEIAAACGVDVDWLESGRGVGPCS